MGKKDITLKDYLSDAKRYADLLNGSIFQGRQIIHAEELLETGTVYAKADNQATLERMADIAMKQTLEGNLFAVWIVENQEYIDYSMPVRIMMQEALAYDKQVKNIKKCNEEKLLKLASQKIFTDKGEFLSKFRKQDFLHPVITLIVYWGEACWQGAKSLHDMIDFGKDEKLARELKALIPEYPVHLLNLSQIHDYKNYQTELRILFELYDRRNDKEEFQKYLNNRKNYARMDSDTYRTLTVLTGIKDCKSNALHNEEANTTMWKAIEDLIADGKTEGKVEGRAEGKIEGKAEGRLDALYELVQDGLLSIKDAAFKASVSEDVFSAELEKRYQKQTVS
ncbi:MAG: Rpn family recombination-promoting nuclease/putative transposase [Blautia sp.]|nr:Rpn family recombination-promoting nuclease/putative transposase [Lachnoclostridium sp.]MCM1210361.1 Rpn family recombination-promoting nuclease/putative transposase [Blautia sp.]